MKNPFNRNSSFSNNESYRVFFRNNEQKQNKTLLIAISWFLITIPVIIFAKLFGKNLHLFDSLSLTLIVHILLVYFLGSMLASFVYVNRPFSRVVKYILLGTIELDMMLVSIDPTFELYISYALVPLISCLYLNKKFTLQTIISCFFVMILSLIIRAFFVVPYYPRTVSVKFWLSAFMIGLSLEYLLNSLIISFVINRYTKIVSMDYEAVLKQMNTQNTITKSYVGMLSQKDPGIEEHLQRTSEYVRLICSKLQLSKQYASIIDDEMLYYMTTSSYLHDIGVISIPDEILQKTTELSKEERRLLNTHPILGEKLIRENLKGIEKKFLKVASEMALCHHEYWNGTGFPKSLKGVEIPLAGRIMAAANELDNLLTDYDYKKGLEFSQAMKRLKEMRGVELDPFIVDVLLASENDIYRIYNYW